METIRNKLGPLIKEKRIQLGITQEGLADRLNISLSFAGQIERGESMPSVETLALIICELNIDPRIIFLEEDSENSAEYNELCLLLCRMSVTQRKLVLDFAKMIRAYKIS